MVASETSSSSATAMSAATAASGPVCHWARLAKLFPQVRTSAACESAPRTQFGQFPRMPGCVDVRVHEDELVISHVREAEPSLQRFGLFQGNARCLGPGRTRQGRSWTVGDRPRRDPRPPTAAPSRHPTGLSPDIVSMRALGDMRPSTADDPSSRECSTGPDPEPDARLGKVTTLGT